MLFKIPFLNAFKMCLDFRPIVICFSRYTPSGQAAWECIPSAQFRVQSNGKPQGRIRRSHLESLDPPSTVAGDENFDVMAKFLVKVHNNPSGAVGGERNHKTNNRVRSELRVRLRRDKCEKQVSVTYNAAQLSRTIGKKRLGDFVLQSATTRSSDIVIALPDDKATFDDDEEDDDFVNDETGGEGILDRFLEQDTEDNDNDEEDEK
jgi:hypothetical protein